MTRSSRADVGAVSRRWEYEGTLPPCFGIFPSTDGGERAALLSLRLCWGRFVNKPGSDCIPPILRPIHRTL